MNRLGALVVVALVTSGCDKFKDDHDTVRLADAETAVRQSELRIQNLEQRLARVENSQADAGNWILWKREQHFGPVSLYAPPQAISAYPTHALCTIAATRLIEPNGRTVTTDPIEVSYGDKTLSFNCLPPGVVPGFKVKY